MKFSKFFVFLLFALPLVAQSQDFKRGWKVVDSLIDKQYFSQAYSKSQKLYDQALKTNDSWQSLVAAHYLSMVGAKFKEDNSDSSLVRYQRLLPKLTGKEKAVCHILLAGFYGDNYTNHSWQIRHNKATDETELDYKLWDKERYQSVVESHLRAAFADKEMLKSVDAETMGNLIELEENGKDGDLTPTLFDVMVLKANRIFMWMDYRKLNDRNFENVDDLMAVTEHFAKVTPKEVDSVQEMSAFVLGLNQEREQLHLSRGDSDRVMMKLYRDRISNCSYFSYISNLREMRKKALPDVIKHFRSGNDPSITELYYMLAEDYYSTIMYVDAVALIDTAITLHPKSHGATECYNLKQRILRPSIDIQIPQKIPSERNALAMATVSNVDTLFFRIIDPIFEAYMEDDVRRKKLLKSVVHKEWTQTVGDRHDYRSRKLFFAIPPMAQGQYLLITSNNRAFDTIITMVKLKVEDVAFVESDSKRAAGFLVDRKTGEPIVGQEVKLQILKGYGSKKEIIATTKTDNHGHFEFPNNMKQLEKSHSQWFVVDYKGVKIEEEFSYYYYEQGESNDRDEFYFDRPVYKPGDTVHFSYLKYTKNRYDAQALEDYRGLFLLRDINRKVQDTLPFVTDQFGVCEGQFAIPADAIPGHWSVMIKNGNSWSFVVEAYKQPKFTVVLSKPAELHEFGKPAHFEGIAASYTAVPLNGAKVTYQIVRTERQPTWRWGWQMWWQSSNQKTVAQGELTTDDKGMFTIEFVPKPDSVSDLSRKPVFEYKIFVSVTDINGETHEAYSSLSVGYENSYLSIGCYDDTVRVRRLNLDGNELEGQVHLTVEMLKTPEKPLLHHDMFEQNKTEMPFSRAEFEQMFPMYDYMDSTADYTLWPVAKKVFDGNGKTTEEKPMSFGLTGLKEGIYKFTAMMVTEQGDTLSSIYFREHEPYNSKQPVKSRLIVDHLEKSTCYIGDTVHLRIGSRHKDVNYLVLIRKNKVLYKHELYKVSNGFVDINVPVTDSLVGGFIIEVAAIKENTFEYESWSIAVPYRHKALDVSFETFRDKLVPGTPERWTLRINEKQGGKPALANLMMTMYDASLDSYGYGSIGWYANIWGQSYTSSVFSQINRNESDRYAYNKALNYKTVPDDYRFHILMLKKGIYSSSYKYNNVRTLSKGGANYRSSSRDVEVTTELVVIENDAEIENELGFVDAADNAYTHELKEVAIAAQKASVVENGEAETLEEEAMPEEEILVHAGSTEEEEPLHVRQNLSTLAFFKPTLRSDENGAVEVSFTAPDLLTKWNIRGLAWTTDMKQGSLSETAITQKPLMVVPNVPRFLRHGDTCIFSVKVSNMDDKEQEISVTLRMTNADGGRVLPMIVGDTVRKITLRAGTSGEVNFTLAVPRAPIFVANYRVVARGQGCSDGEQAPIPLLPSRQLVTESMAFYINGAGEKHYEMKHLTELDTTAPDFSLSTLGLTVDLTPNPIWMVMQSLPYVQQRQNPSNIYLANAIYTNSLSYAIVKNNPQIETIFREWENAATSSSSFSNENAFISELDRNPDLKQTVMSETPWLRDANSEEQRHRDVARFFDNTTIKRQLTKDISRLLDAQRSDGGWSWINGSSYSSLYTTQYILKTFGLLQKQGVELDSRTRRALNNAMDYIDRETYTYYKKYIKNRGYDVVNLDYLYVRSYYPDNKLSKSQKEAYDFFYNNAKKYNKDYQSLFTQAMLSVVFNRQGDKKLAVEMAKRIKEKALYSDEMGMYWRDNVSSWSWSERPIETQAMLIRVFDEVLGDRESIAKMQQWILKQKQTTNWNTDVSTVSAIQALLAGNGSSSNANSPIRIEPSKMSLTFGSHQLATDTTRHQLHVSQRLGHDEVKPADGNLTIRKEDGGIAWGAMYWQYFEQVDKIPSSSMGVTLKRTLYRVERDGQLSRIATSQSSKHAAETESLKVGDKVRVRIEIACDRNLEYLELKDPRCAAMEPVSTASGWQWNGGLSYYLAVTNAAQTLYIDRLNKGNYVVEYDMYVNNAGTYVTAPTTIQCLYAPEFRALCPAENLKIK